MRIPTTYLIMGSLGWVQVVSSTEDSNWEGSATFPFWQMGQQMLDAIMTYPGCFANTTFTNPPPDWPCSGLQFFYPNCTLGLSLNAVLAKDPSYMVDPFESNVTIPSLSYASQQNCYCQSDYWEYVRGCNTCMFQHGYPQLSRFIQKPADWIPPAWIEQQSSAYCGASPITQPALDFLASFTPTSTGLAAIPTATSTLASTATAVSDYFTLSSTLAIPTQTSQTGTLQSAAATTSKSGAAPALVAAAPAFGSIGSLLIAVLVAAG